QDFVAQHVSELVVKPLELVNVGHDDSHAGSVTAGALNLFHETQFEKAPVENTGEAIEVGQLLYALDVVGVLNGRGADVGHRFQRLQIAVAERIRQSAVERENSQRLPERDQWDAHARGRFRKEFHAGGSA